MGRNCMPLQLNNEIELTCNIVFHFWILNNITIVFRDSARAFGDEQMCKNHHRGQLFFFALMQTSDSLPGKYQTVVQNICLKAHTYLS